MSLSLKKPVKLIWKNFQVRLKLISIETLNCFVFLIGLYGFRNELLHSYIRAKNSTENLPATHGGRGENMLKSEVQGICILFASNALKTVSFKISLITDSSAA